MKNFTWPEIIGFFEKKYIEIDYNKLHILKSLVYFTDADDEPMPLMLQDISWEEVKNDIKGKVNKWLKV